MVRDYKDYIDSIHDEYPDVPREVIEQILRKGISRLQNLVHRDFDVHLANNKGPSKYHLYLVRPVADKFDRWQRALRRLRKLKKFRETYGSNTK